MKKHLLQFGTVLFCVFSISFLGCQKVPSPQEGNLSSECLYISLGNEKYTTYSYDGEQTPAELLKGIEELTGWKLSLADEITSGKGGMTVMFAEDACLFTGPPEEQKEEFHVFDATSFTLAVLDSIQETLQHWASPVNPDSVDIYFGMGMDQPLTLENLNLVWPLEEPYSHEGMEALVAEGNKEKDE